eukprot:1184817-Pyramimonas_sp.AAC.1
MYTKVRPELGFAETYWQGVCRFAPRRHSGSTAARALKSTNMERSCAVGKSRPFEAERSSKIRKLASSHRGDHRVGLRHR